MRRLRDAGIVTMLLLGLSGCAGVQQRLGLTEPPYQGDEGTEERPLSRLAFWRRHRAEETTSVSESVDSGRPTMIAGSGMSPADESEDRPGLLRRLPLVGRLWKGQDRDDSDLPDVPSLKYASPPASTGEVANLPPRTRSGASSSSAEIVAATNPAVRSDPSGSEGESLRELSTDPTGTKPQVDASTVPVGLPAPSEPPPLSPTPPPTLPGPPTQQGATPPPPVVPSQATTSPTPIAAPGAGAQLDAPDLAPVTSRGPVPPSPTIGAEGSTASGSWTSTVTSTPGPVWPMEPPSKATVVSGQSFVTTSSQSGYVSGGCTESCGAGCKAHKLCPFKKHKQVVYASSQYGAGVSCEGTCKVKKPCFLKTWLHHKSSCKVKGCKGCKSCSYCGEPASMVSVEAPIVSSQY